MKVWLIYVGMNHISDWPGLNHGSEVLAPEKTPVGSCLNSGKTVDSNEG